MSDCDKCVECNSDISAEHAAEFSGRCEYCNESRENDAEERGAAVDCSEGIHIRPDRVKCMYCGHVAAARELLGKS